MEEYSMADTYTLYGSYASCYTAKVRTYLRFLTHPANVAWYT